MGEEQRRGRPGDRVRQNEQVRAAVVRCALSASEHERLRREVEIMNRNLGENLGFHEVQVLAEQIVSDRRRR